MCWLQGWHLCHSEYCKHSSEPWAYLPAPRVAPGNNSGFMEWLATSLLPRATLCLKQPRTHHFQRWKLVPLKCSLALFFSAISCFFENSFDLFTVSSCPWPLLAMSLFSECGGQRPSNNHWSKSWLFLDDWIFNISWKKPSNIFKKIITGVGTLNHFGN